MKIEGLLNARRVVALLVSIFVVCAQPVCSSKVNGIKVLLRSMILALVPMTRNELINDRAGNTMAKKNITSITTYCPQSGVKSSKRRSLYPTVTG
jgi:hypothetical protein